MVDTSNESDPEIPIEPLVGGDLGTWINSQGSLGAALADAGLVGALGMFGAMSYIAYAKPDKLTW